MGRGLMPDTYGSYRAQRYRWVYGNMQTLKRHAVPILRGRGEVDGRRARLTPAQRYQFAAGWMPWLADGLSLVAGVLALAWTALVVAAPGRFEVPPVALSAALIVLVAIRLAKTFSVHCATCDHGMRGALGATLGILALAHTAGRGVIAGLLTSSRPFLRTPKCEESERSIRALRHAVRETFMLTATAIAVAVTMLAGRTGNPAGIAWIVVLAVLALPYAAAGAVALVSTLRPDRPAVPQREPEIASLEVISTTRLGHREHRVYGGRRQISAVCSQDVLR